MTNIFSFLRVPNVTLAVTQLDYGAIGDVSSTLETTGNVN